MKNIIDSSTTTTIVIQPQLLENDSKLIKRIFRLGWISFILGICAFLIHYISLEYLSNFSPINAGIISGFFLIIAGLSSVVAGYKQISYRYLIHAQIWSFIVNIILAPGLIAVSITALIIDNQDIYPICQPTVSTSRIMLSGNVLEIYPSNIPCIKITNLFKLTQILNTILLIIGILCFFIHMFLLSTQRKLIKQIKINENEINKKIIIYTQPTTIDRNQTIFNADDPPPKYEDLPSMQTISE
ncbi:unnamed protein product [Adineta steineri]|uniref:Transmembrane protein n=1 Tax=Adineta steineri TaxID=433720 RepID=A0A814VZM8_9BILA|nr:unnamed protein product [Adineta steineri]